MTTLSETMITACQQGYTENFRVFGSGLVSADEKFVYAPGNVKIVNFFRFEGNSNTDDNPILYLIETDDKRKGTLIDAYGVYADAFISSFISKVDDIQKKPKVVSN